MSVEFLKTFGSILVRGFQIMALRTLLVKAVRRKVVQPFRRPCRGSYNEIFKSIPFIDNFLRYVVSVYERHFLKQYKCALVLVYVFGRIILVVKIYFFLTCSSPFKTTNIQEH